MWMFGQNYILNKSENFCFWSRMAEKHFLFHFLFCKIKCLTSVHVFRKVIEKKKNEFHYPETDGPKVALFPVILCAKGESHYYQFERPWSVGAGDRTHDLPLTRRTF